MSELTAFTVDTDDDLEDQESLFHDGDGDELARADPKRTSCFSGLCSSICVSSAPEVLSIQSGDIVHPSPHSSSSSSSYSSGSVHNFFFKLVHSVVKVVCCQVETRRVPIPVLSSILLGGILLAVVLLVSLAITLFPPTINSSLRSFSIPDHPASEHWDAFQAADNDKIENSGTNRSQRSTRSAKSWTPSQTLPSVTTRGLSSSQFSSCAITSWTQRNPNWVWVMNVVFKAKRGKNVLSEENVKYIHSIEDHIYNHPHYPYVCHFTGTSTVPDPVNSLLTYLYPRKDDGSYEWPPDGLVKDYQKTLHDYLTNVESTLYYTGGRVGGLEPGANVTSSLLRSQVQVGTPLPCYNSYYDRTGDQEEIALQFFLEVADYLEHASSKDIEVLYGGTLIFDYEVNAAISHDTKLAAVSLGLIVFFMFLLTGFSPFSTMAGIFAIAASFPLAFCLYRALQFESVGILNMLSPFVIIGIGVDDVFVYLNTFKQSQRLQGLDTVHKRLTHTILTAGKATFFTSATTAVAFGANGLSQIPAVKQFGVFMFLIVSCCYLSVAIIMPLYLHVWHSCLCPLENFVYRPVVVLLLMINRRLPDCSHLSLCLRGCCRTSSHYSTALSVRMQDIADDDSGIDILDQGNGSVDSNSDSSSAGSGSDPNLAQGVGGQGDENESPLTEGDTGPEAVVLLVTNEVGEEEDEQLLLGETHAQQQGGPKPHSIPVSSRSVPAAEHELTTVVQVLMLKYLARPIMYLQLVKIQSLPLRLVARLTLVFVFSVIFLMSIGGMVQLKPTDHPPQFFDPDSNIQKMMDLAGNLTDTNTVNCNNCFAWHPGPGGSHSGGSQPTQPTKPTDAPPTPHTSATSATDAPTEDPTETPPTPSQSSSDTPTPSSGSSPTASEPGTETEPTNKPTDSGSSPTASEPGSGSEPTPKPGTGTESEPTPKPGTGTEPTPKPGTGTGTEPTPKPETGNGTEPTPKPPDSKVSSHYTNNVIVYTVFGIKDITRKYSTSHVLPAEGEGDSAVLDLSFKNSFTYPRDSTYASTSLLGTVNALCRICKNITDPKNGLVLNRNAQCFPDSISKTTTFEKFLSNLGVSNYRSLPGCQGLPPSNTTVKAKFGNETTTMSTSLTFLAMAFQSTTNEGASPFDSYDDYTKWEDFFQSEMAEIQKLSGPGEPYEGAYDILSSGFQTSEYWVTVNVEVVAIYGALYGIVCSLIFCSFLVVVLSHNWRIVVSMHATILGILVTLLALFQAFGWTVGIVEAISLSILVGNSVDYCIHLSEGYMAADTRHLAFVESFGFTQTASIRVKRVMSAISFIGVSILSSAITTIVATTPLLGTQIQLLARFGQILLLDTLIAIIYTLIFCSSFLGLIGPLTTKYSPGKIVNAVVTIVSALAVYGVIFLILYVLSKVNANIPGPDVIFSPPSSF